MKGDLGELRNLVQGARIKTQWLWRPNTATSTVGCETSINKGTKTQQSRSDVGSSE